MIELHNFCNVDLSALYFDIRKDSLYCDAHDATRRRAARTVMATVFDHLVRWLAPILCFTTEEAFLARYGDSDDSVHLHDFAVVDATWHDAALAAKWEQIRAIRRVVTGAMELARNDKKIGSSLQAKPQVWLTAAQNDVLKDLDFAEIVIRSGIDIAVGAAPAEAFCLADVADVGVMVQVADGQKCERCWQVLPEVGQHADHPGLCHRCHDVVTHPSKVAA